MSALTIYSRAIKAIEDLETTERAMKLAAITADAEVSVFIAQALKVIRDKRGELQEALSDARILCTKYHRITLSSGMPFDVPAGVTMGASSAKPTAMRVTGVLQCLSLTRCSHRKWYSRHATPQLIKL